MAIYENKFEIGDKVIVTNKMRCFDLWRDMASVMGVEDFSMDWPNEREVHKVISYTLHPKTHHFIYHVKDCVTEQGYLMQEEGLELYNGQDKEQPYKGEAFKDESRKEVTKTGYVKCDKFGCECNYLTEGKVYKITGEHCEYGGSVENDRGNEIYIHLACSAHTESVWQYTTEEEYLAQQTAKQQYKQRAKWVMNTGSKPDLPDGTLVKAVFDEGGVIAEVDKLRWSIADNIGQTNIVKWKLANDWNKVVDGQAPDIDGDTLVEVVCKDEHGRFTTTTTKDGLFWDSVKKWRYAKEKKAK